MNKVHSTETGHAVIAYLFCSNEPENWGTSRFSNYWRQNSWQLVSKFERPIGPWTIENLCKF